jgi:prepilin-type processing-associated H-X9-DG protein
MSRQPLSDEPQKKGLRLFAPDSRALEILSVGLALVSYRYGLHTAIPSILFALLAVGKYTRAGVPVKLAAQSALGLSLILVPCLIFGLAAHQSDQYQKARKIRSACQNNQKQLAIVFEAYSNESRGTKYPELSPEPGRLMFSVDSAENSATVYPKFFADANLVACPANHDAPSADDDSLTPQDLIDDHSYYYFGYALFNEDEVERFAMAYRTRIAAGLSFDEDLAVGEGQGSAGADHLYRLQGPYVPEITSREVHPSKDPMFHGQIPVLMDRATIVTDSEGTVRIDAERSNHPNGANVLYLDGHVEFVKMGRWPLTEETLNILRSLDEMGP